MAPQNPAADPSCYLPVAGTIARAKVSDVIHFSPSKISLFPLIVRDRAAVADDVVVCRMRSSIVATRSQRHESSNLG